MVDLLGSILSSMDKESKSAGGNGGLPPPTRSSVSDGYKQFRESMKRKLQSFISDSSLKQIEFPPMEKLKRNIIHEIAEDLGLVSHSFQISKDEERITLVFKKDVAPNEEEIIKLKIKYNPEIAEVLEFQKKRQEAASKVQEALRIEIEMTEKAEKAKKEAMKQAPKYLEKSKYKRVLNAQPELIAVDQTKRDRRTIPEIEAEIAAKKRQKKEKTEPQPLQSQHSLLQQP